MITTAALDRALSDKNQTWIATHALPRGSGSLEAKNGTHGGWFYYSYRDRTGKRDRIPLGPYRKRGENGLSLAEAVAKAQELANIYRYTTRNVRAYMDVQQQKLDTEVQDKARLHHLDKQYNFTSSTSVGLAGFREFSKFANDGWVDFQEYRKSCLSQGLRFGVTPEKASENILERFFVQILGWPVSGLSWQVDYADLVLSNNFYKYLIVEVKRPGQLNTPARWRKAINQARGYASKQGVSKIAVSDGTRMYAADCGEYGLKDRVNTRLDTDVPDLNALWWLSFYGIHQHCANPPPGWELEEILTESVDTDFDEEYVLTYKGLPSWCFAYVGNVADTNTWKLPYRLPDGQVDTIRLPKALSALLGTFRGKKVQGIPERALPSVYEALYRGVVAADKVPGLDNPVSPVYWQFAEAIKQIRQSVGQTYVGN